MDLTEERLDSREVFRGHIVTLTVDQVRLPNGGQAVREVARPPDGVGVVALGEGGRAVVVDEFRFPRGRTSSPSWGPSMSLRGSATRRSTSIWPGDCTRRQATPTRTSSCPSPGCPLTGWWSWYSPARWRTARRWPPC